MRPRESEVVGNVGRNYMLKTMAMRLAVLTCGAGAALAQAPTWKPTKRIEVVVPFAPGGASDQMARMLQAVIQKSNLSEQSIVVVNEPAAAGGEAMIEIRNASGDAHKLITTSIALCMIPLCPLSARRMSYTAEITNDTAWSDIPTCGEQGIKLTYNMLRGTFMPGKMTPAQQAYYVSLFKLAIETPDWKAYVERNALLPGFREGQSSSSS